MVYLVSRCVEKLAQKVKSTATVASAIAQITFQSYVARVGKVQNWPKIEAVFLPARSGFGFNLSHKECIQVFLFMYLTVQSPASKL